MPVLRFLWNNKRFRVFTRAGVLVFDDGHVFRQPRFTNTNDSRFTGTAEEISMQEFRHLTTWNQIRLIHISPRYLTIWFNHHDMVLEMRSVSVTRF